MKESNGNSPDRLRAEGATDLERRLLEAVAHEQPSAELSKRMARAIGVSSAAIRPPTDGTATGTGSTASGASVGSGFTAVLPWVAGAVLGVAVTGAIVGTWWSTRSVHQERPSPPDAPSRAVAPAPPPSGVPVETAPATESRFGAPFSARRNRSATARIELREQIALIDSARASIAANAGQHALDTLRHYQEKYPEGSFGPEAAALKIEALVKLGRRAEAHTLAERFTSEYGAGPLADRVARIAGLSQP